MSYIESALGKGEEVVVRANVSWLSQIRNLCIGVVGVLWAIGAFSSGQNWFIPLAIGVWFFVVAFLNVVTTELALTNRKIIAKFGLIRRDTIELKNEKIESIKVNQGIVGRILNYGSLSIGGTGGSHAPIPYIGNPMGFRRKVNEFLEEK